MAVDDILLLDDGKMRLRVDSATATDIDCTVLVGGKLSSRKGVNKLGGGIAAPALTEKDKADIRAMEVIKPDFVAVSFVAWVADIDETRALLTDCLLYTSPSPRDVEESRMPSSA